MNIVIGMLVVIGVLLLVRPAQAANSLLVGSFIPAVMQNTIKVPILGDVLASSEGRILAVDGSGEKGVFSLKEVPENLDTQINVQAFGLTPGEQYIAIYHKNSSCELEDNSIEKSVKGAFFVDDKGEARVEDIVKDSANRIGSVSLRKARDFEAVACGGV